MGLLLLLLTALPRAVLADQPPDRAGFVQTFAVAEAAACDDHDTNASHHGQRACCGLTCSASALIVAGGFPDAPPAGLAAARVAPKGDAQVSASRLYRPPNA
jgi:hypothetical protein